jgi:hypothetical protein
MKKSSKKKQSFSSKCLNVGLDVVLVIAFAVAASVVMNAEMLSAPASTNAAMRPAPTVQTQPVMYK